MILNTQSTAKVISRCYSWHTVFEEIKFTYFLPVTPVGVQGSNEAPPPLSVTGQPLNGVQLWFMVSISASTLLRRRQWPGEDLWRRRKKKKKKEM